MESAATETEIPEIRVRPRRDAAEIAMRQKINAMSKRRHDELRAAKLCINGQTHGPATDGTLCRRCRLVHRHGKQRGVEIYEAELAAKAAP